MKPDDTVVSAHQYEQIQTHALSCLQNSDALGVFPTPIEAVTEHARLDVVEDATLDEGFLRGLKRKFGSSLKSALGKVRGVLDSVGRVVHIDKTLYITKKVFLKLHEVGHSILPWQRDIYRGIQDCEKTLDPEVSLEFEREANLFASEVLFQLDEFEKEAADYDFGIKVPLKLKRKFGASAYATIRRYVTKSHRNCAVLVLNPPELRSHDGFVATKRRVVCSKLFSQSFGNLTWPDQVTPDSKFGSFVPIPPRKMSGSAPVHIADVNGTTHLCYCEGFSSGYQVFLLNHSVRVETRTLVSLS